MLVEVDSLGRMKSGFAILCIDLDHFKQVNDTHGHAAGDSCLQRVVDAISTTIGRRGTLYRLGSGDEFGVLLPDFCTEEACATAERIRRAIERSNLTDVVAVTGSIGVSGTDVFAEVTAEDLLHAADLAMYSSKKNGKNRVTAASLAATKREALTSTYEGRSDAEIQGKLVELSLKPKLTREGRFDREGSIELLLRLRNRNEER